MELMRLLLTGGLIFIAARIGLTDENSENNSDLIVKDRLPNYIKPKHYDIQLTIKPNVGVISGVCGINISVEIPTQNISLHAHKQHIQILETNLYSDSKTVHKLQNYTYNNESHILTFHLNNEIPHGRYLLKITFTNFGTNNGEGFFTTSYANEKEDKKWLAVTNFYPIGARRVFPCWDEPAIKATFAIAIIHHHNYLPLSNMPNIPILYSDENMVLSNFATTTSLSTYQIAIVWLDSGVLVGGIWCRRSTLPVNLANSMFNKTMQLGIEWGFHNFTHVRNIAIPGFQYDSIGYWRITFYRETAIIYDDKIDPVGHKINVACLMAREAARQWFSKISPSWWSHSWLNEGIVRLLGQDAIHEIFPDYGRLSIVQMKQESLRLDTQSIMKPLISQINSPSEINSLFSFSYYIKGPAILRMLQHLVTNKLFRKGLHSYLNRHMYRSATIDDFWATMEDALDETLHHGILSVNSLKRIFHPWTYRAHYPVLNVKQESENKTRNGRTIHVWKENVNGTDWCHWWIPITYTTYSNFSNFLFDDSEWLLTLPKRVIIVRVTTENDWFIVNKQQIGYYRVNYDTKDWLRIAKQLNSENYTKIDVLNRAQIIDDAYHFFMTDKLNLVTFLELAKYLKQETDFVAWYPMIKAIEDMSCYFPFYESADIKDKMCAILDGLLKKIGYEGITKNDIFNSLREEIAKWACIMGSSKCMEQATLKLRFLFAHKEQTLLPYWKHWTYCNGLMNSSTSFQVFKNYFYELNDTSDQEKEYVGSILKFMVCSGHARMIFNYLLFPENYTKLQNVDRIKIFHSIIARHVKNNLILDHILANFEKIKLREVSAIAVLINIINHVYSKEQLDKVTAFAEDYVKKKMIMASNAFIGILPPLKENEFMKNNQKIFEELILIIKRKIETRLSEIKSHTNRYKKFVEVK